MRPRNATLLISAGLIAAACAYKVTRTYDSTIVGQRRLLCPAPASAQLLPSQHRPRTVKLAAYLSRHRVIVVFFDRAKGAEGDPTLVRLRRDFDRLKSADVKIVGVSTAIPQDNRPPAAGRPRLSIRQPREEFPFPLLTDFSPKCRFHKSWGRFDNAKDEPLTGVFLIDRTGYVLCDGEKPTPLDNPDATIDELIK